MNPERTTGATLLAMIFAFLAGPGQTSAAISEEFRIQPEESHLFIEGTSNVNTFRYHFTDLPAEASKQRIGDLSSALDKLLQASLTLNLRSFDSGHAKMNRDFRNLLKADEYPAIIITIENITILNENGRPTGLESGDASEIWVRAYFTIAGSSLLHAFPVTVEREDAGFKLAADLEMNIEDFGLTPPKALFGMIKVRKHITISFDLALEPTDRGDIAWASGNGRRT